MYLRLLQRMKDARLIEQPSSFAHITSSEDVYAPGVLDSPGHAIAVRSSIPGVC